MTNYHWWGKAEPELRSLYDWIDLQQHSAGSSRGSTVGALIGASSGLMGATIGILCGAFRFPPLIGVGIPLALWGGMAVAILVWYARSRTDQDRALSQTVSEMRTFYWKLMTARWQGNILEMIGPDCAGILNEGAGEYLQCRNALRSPGWRAVDASSPYAQVRVAASTAMETAMARLVTLIGQGVDPKGPMVADLLKEMKNATQVATETANRLASHRGLPADATVELRKVLGDMEALNAADDEVGEMRIQR